MMRHRTIISVVGALCVLLVGVAIATAQGPETQQATALAGPTFTYQGRLQDGSGPITGTCDFSFRLLDAGSSEIATDTVNGKQVTNGYFTAELDFGAGTFDGNERFLEINADCGDGTKTFGPQPLTPTPYALALPGLWTDSSASVPNIIGGYSGNVVDGGVSGATIGGGGDSGAENHVTGDHGTVSGGSLNTAGVRGVVGGGQNNSASSNATVGGGLGNEASDQGATVSGGQSNVADYLYGTVGGGLHNRVSAYGGTIAGGAPSDPGNSTGTRNRVVDHYGTVGGGGNNLAGSDDATLDSAQWATVSGGDQNVASGPYATVAGGRTNAAGGGSSVYHATVGGGVDNQATGSEATVSGGNGNVAAGTASSVPGGFANEANGNYSFAAGYRAKAEHAGSFVWADAQKADFVSSGDDQFIVRAAGGVGIGTNDPSAPLHAIGPDVGTNSDPDGHVVLIESTNNDADNQVLAVKTAYTGNPGQSNNFVTFFNGNDTAVGAIQGDGAGGVQYTSGGADFAEYMPRLNPDEVIDPSEIVGVVGHAVTKRTDGVSQVLVVSSQPIVAGNSPGQRGDARANYETVAFVGQVPVKVHGSVSAGDYIIPSGNNDGTGVAVSLDEITASQAGNIVGRALESSAGTGVTTVNTLVGLPQEQILTTMLEKRDARIAQLEAQIDTLDAQNAQLASRMDGLEQKVLQREPAPLANLPVPPWLIGGFVFGGIVIWQRRRERNLS